MINVELLRKVVEQIEADPASWDQDAWIDNTGCKTTFCIAGWTCVLAGMVSLEGKLTSDGAQYINRYHGYGFGNWDPRIIPWPTMARDLLGLSDGQADALFLSDFGPPQELRHDLWELLGVDLGPRPDAEVTA